MERIIKAKPINTICKLYSWKATFWIAFLVLSIMYSEKNWPVSIGFAIFELVSSIIAYCVVNSFSKAGKCAIVIKIWSGLLFVIFSLLLVANLLTLILLLLQLFGITNMTNLDSDPVLRYLTDKSIIKIIFVSIAYIFTSVILLRISRYYYWIYLTFAHIQKEQKSNQIMPYEFKKYRLNQRAKTFSSMIILIGILFILILALIIILKIPISLDRTSAISIGLFGYLGYIITSPFVIITCLVIKYIEVQQIRKFAFIFEEVHTEATKEKTEPVV